MKFLKKSAAILILAALLSVLLIPAASAAEGNSCGDGVTWSYNAASNKLTISGSGAMTNFTSPEEVPWAQHRAEIRKIEVASTVTSIGSYAFHYLTALESVSLEGTALTSIGDYAFYMCKALKEISIPASVKTIGESAFAYCTALESVTLLGIESIGKMVFAGCTALTSVTLEGTLTAIPEKAFLNCTALKTLAYSDSVVKENIASDAFANTSEEHFTQTTIRNESTLTIRYLNAEGAEIAPAHVETLQKGAAYAVTTPAVDGYTIPAGKTVVEGTMGGANISIDVVYEAVQIEETTPPTEDTSTPETTPNNPEGENDGSSVIFIVVLVIILVAIVVGGFLLVRSDKQLTKDSATVRKNGDKSGSSNKKGKK